MFDNFIISSLNFTSRSLKTFHGYFLFPLHVIKNFRACYQHYRMRVSLILPFVNAGKPWQHWTTAISCFMVFFSFPHTLEEKNFQLTWIKLIFLQAPILFSLSTAAKQYEKYRKF